jgi:hypothetical protein
MPAIHKKILHPKTQKGLNRVFVKGAGWFGWNTVFKVYNNIKNYAQLQESQVEKIDFGKLPDGVYTDDELLQFRAEDGCFCLHCKSHMIETTSTRTESGPTLVRKVKCSTCGNAWYETYELKMINDQTVPSEKQ